MQVLVLHLFCKTVVLVHPYLEHKQHQTQCFFFPPTHAVRVLMRALAHQMNATGPQWPLVLVAGGHSCSVPSSSQPAWPVGVDPLTERVAGQRWQVASCRHSLA